MRTFFVPMALAALAACSSTQGAHAPDRDAQELAAMRVKHVELLDVRDMDGAELGLREHLEAGRSVALVFWQSWCGPCRAEAPRVEEASRRIGHEVRIVGVVSGPDDAVDEEAVRAFVDDLGLTYPQVRDRHAALAKHFRVTGTPTIVWIGPDGRVLFHGHDLPPEWAVTP